MQNCVVITFELTFGRDLGLGIGFGQGHGLGIGSGLSFSVCRGLGHRIEVF